MMSQKRDRSDEESIVVRNVLTRIGQSDQEEREELKLHADVLAESIPALAERQLARDEIDVSDLIAVVILLLDYIQAHPDTSYDIDEDDDVARCTYHLINQIIDYQLVAQSQPVVHQALKDNSDMLRDFFRVTAHSRRQFNPVLIDQTVVDEEATASYSFR